MNEAIKFAGAFRIPHILQSKRLTNHSARKRMIQKQNDSDIPPCHIMQLSGHRNVQSINNYSQISQQQQKKNVKNTECDLN